MKVLGIDPGTIIMGYGVVEEKEGEIALIEYGVLKCLSRSPVGERLSFLYRELGKVIAKFQPDVCAIEEPFIGENVKTALAIGKAQAVAILASANYGIPIYEYSPAEVKRQIANYGASSKGQVQEMIRLELRLDHIPEPADAADALAVAICHLRAVHLERLLSRRR